MPKYPWIIPDRDYTKPSPVRIIKKGIILKKKNRKSENIRKPEKLIRKKNKPNAHYLPDKKVQKLVIKAKQGDKGAYAELLSNFDNYLHTIVKNKVKPEKKGQFGDELPRAGLHDEMYSVVILHFFPSQDKKRKNARKSYVESYDPKKGPFKNWLATKARRTIDDEFRRRALLRERNPFLSSISMADDQHASKKPSETDSSDDYEREIFSTAHVKTLLGYRVSGMRKESKEDFKIERINPNAKLFFYDRYKQGKGQYARDKALRFLIDREHKKRSKDLVDALQLHSNMLGYNLEQVYNFPRTEYVFRAYLEKENERQEKLKGIKTESTIDLSKKNALEKLTEFMAKDGEFFIKHPVTGEVRRFGGRDATQVEDSLPKYSKIIKRFNQGKLDLDGLWKALWDENSKKELLRQEQIRQFFFDKKPKDLIDIIQGYNNKNWIKAIKKEKYIFDMVGPKRLGYPIPARWVFTNGDPNTLYNPIRETMRKMKRFNFCDRVEFDNMLFKFYHWYRLRQTQKPKEAYRKMKALGFKDFDYQQRGALMLKQYEKLMGHKSKK